VRTGSRVAPYGRSRTCASRRVSTSLRGSTRWTHYRSATHFHALTPDVVVGGGGVTGVTTALLLQQAGRDVTLIEARRLGGSVTTHSTVKVTVGHGTLYSKIRKSRGLDAARIYAEANRAGFERIRDLVSALDIDCMFEHGHPHVVYAEKAEDVEQMEREVETAAEAGLAVRVAAEAPVPFPVARALHFESQAHFHPGRYVAGLAEAFVSAGGTVIEGARHRGRRAARRVRGEHRPRSAVDRARGGRDAVPDPQPGRAVHAAEGPPVVRRRRSPPGGDQRRHMTINVGSPTHSTRSASLNGEELLIVVGEGHEVGHVTDTAQRWVWLQDWARERFGVQEFR
jgi:glycine/D-amino acid oxidase-like deaminating enzyme